MTIQYALYKIFLKGGGKLKYRKDNIMHFKWTWRDYYFDDDEYSNGSEYNNFLIKYGQIK